MGKVKHEPDESAQEGSSEEVLKPSKKRKSVNDAKASNAVKKEAELAEKPDTNPELGTVKVNDDGESYIELSEWRRVTVRKYGGKTLVDIRQVYKDKATGQMKPAAKGLSLSLEQWQVLKSSIDKVDALVRDLDG